MATAMQGVLLAGDPADLHPHGTVRPTGRRQRLFSVARNEAGLAHENSLEARLKQRRHLGGGVHAGLGDASLLREGSAVRQTLCPRPVHLEAVQVTLVHAHDQGAYLKCAFQLGFVVYLDEGGHGEFAGDA